MKKGSERMEWIDSLRGLAAVGVMLMHLLERLRGLYPAEEVYSRNSLAGLMICDFINLGKVGVVTFFMISGFVIPFSLYNKNLRQFVTSRFFRLYPAYWLSILLIVIVAGNPGARVLLANITMFQKFIGVPDMIGVYWTLQIELIFYFLCGALFYFHIIFKNKTVLISFYACLFTALLFATVRYITEIKVPVALPLGLTVMFLGMIFKKYLSEPDSFTRKQLFIHIGSLVVVLLPICFLAYNKDYGFDESWDKYFVSYLLALVIFALFFVYKWHNRVLVFLGAISYSLYLLHPIALDITDALKIKYWQNLSSVSYLIVFLTLTLCLSVFCYFFVEKPAIRIGKTLMRSRLPAYTHVQDERSRG